MSIPIEKQNSRLMREMFGRIAPRYDFITRVFSYGMDLSWKRTGLELAQLPREPRVLDLASGTGDFSLLVSQQRPGARVIAADLTFGMLPRARERGVARAVCADALHLPFPDRFFDCVFVGYGLRNFPVLHAALAEIARITRPGGSLVTLDFFLPRNPVWRRLYLGYLVAQGALWGAILHRSMRTYTYIPDSLKSFLTIDQLTAALGCAGYGSVAARSFLLGGIGVHRAVISPDSRPRRSAGSRQD